MSIILKPLCWAILVLAFFSSCSKSSRSVTENLCAGTWTYLKIAKDTNHNNVADANEWVTLSSLGYTHAVISFNADSTGYEVGTDTTHGVQISDSVTMNWVYHSNTNYLDVIAYNTNHYHIDQITNNTLIYKDTSGGITTWSYLVR